jgi:hypothetical protein
VGQVIPAVYHPNQCANQSKTTFIMA